MEHSSIGSPLVSILMPVYNAHKYVDKAIESILRQTMPNFEFLIVDDGSTDNSAFVIQSYYDKRIRFFHSDENKGYPSAMNIALSHAKGEFVARMDADDISSPNRLEVQLKFIQNHPELAFVGIFSYWISPYGRIGYRTVPNCALGKEWIEESWDSIMDGSRLFTDPSVLFRKADVERHGGYHTYQRTGMDVDLWLRILEDGKKAGTIMQPLYGRRWLPSAITFNGYTANNNQVPRLLAQERKSQGSDSVSGGENPPEAPLLTDKNAKLRQINASYTAAISCVGVGDIRGAFLFVVANLKLHNHPVAHMKGLVRLAIALTNRVIRFNE